MAPLAAQPLSWARRWASVAVLSLSLLVITMDMTILNIALPDMAAELHPTSDQQLWIVDIYTLLLAGLLIPWAAVGDRWGRKRMLMLGYSIFAVASLLVLFAESAEMVIAIRALLGIGGAMIMPTTLSSIRVIFTNPAERATALSIWAAVSGLGAAVGPLVGGFLIEHFSWHAAFLVNVPLMVAGVIAGAMILPESRAPSPGKWDAFAALLSLVGMVALVWAMKEFGKHASFALPDAWAALVIGIATLTWFVVRCRRSDHPLLEMTLFRSRAFSAGTLAALSVMFSMGAAMLLLAQWLQLVAGFSPIETGLSFIPMAVASAIGSVAAPPLAKLIGVRAVLAGGLGVASSGMILIGIGPGSLTTVIVIIALSLIGAGIGSLAIGSALIMSSSPEEKAGSASALEETSYELGATLGVTVLGSISALIYRAEVAGSDALRKVEPRLAADAEESLGAAVAMSERLGLPALSDQAGSAFTHAMQVTGYTGGAVMVAAAILVFFLTPKGTNISGSAH
ncbi:MAG: MFS transporter [Leucobacter sp.]